MSAVQSDRDGTHFPGRIVPDVSRVLQETGQLFPEIQLHLPQDSYLQDLTHNKAKNSVALVIAAGIVFLLYLPCRPPAETWSTDLTGTAELEW